MIIEILTIIYFITMIIVFYLQGYVVGSEGDCWFLLLLFSIIGIIVFLIKTAIYGLELSFDLSSSEWATIVLAVMAIWGIPFVIGWISGECYFHDDIVDAIKKIRS